MASDAFDNAHRTLQPVIPPGLDLTTQRRSDAATQRHDDTATPSLRLRSLRGDLVDGGVVGVQPPPVRRQHFQFAEAMSLSAVDQL